MLRLVVSSGTGRNANFGPDAVGKTGTTQDNKDAWFVGFDRRDKLVTGVWFGNDAWTPMKDITGSNLPALVWRNFYLRLRPDKQDRA